MKTLIYVSVILFVTAIDLNLNQPLGYELNKAEDRQNLDIERIEVLGTRSLNHLFKLRQEKRFAFMQDFNSLVEDEDLHFECKDQTSTGSHIRKQVCRNNFDWRIIQEIVEDEVSRGNVTGAYAVALMGNKEQRQRKQDLVSEINTLLEENQHFSNTLQAFREANLAYQKAHAKKFGSLSQYKAILDNND